MKKLALILLFLAACTQAPETTEIPIPDTLPPPEPQQPPIEKVDLQPTPVHACALLTEDDGLKYCNLSVQRSMKDQEGCEQAFIGTALPHPYVVLETLEFESKQEAKEKYEWDKKTKGAQNDAQPYLFGVSYIYDSNGRHIELLKGTKVLRVDEKPSNACGNLDGLTAEFFRKA